MVLVCIKRCCANTKVRLPIWIIATETAISRALDVNCHKMIAYSQKTFVCPQKPLYL